METTLATWEFIEFNTPETKLLADLEGISGDLSATKEICERYIKGSTDSSFENILLQESLCAAAIIRYGRSFGTGVRRWDQQTILDSLTDRLKRAHDYFKDLRDKWIAHSVNSFEENIVQVYLVPDERGPKGVSSISVTQNRVVFLSLNDIELLVELAEAVNQQVQVLIQQEKGKALAYLQTLPVESLYAKLANPPKQPKAKHYSKPRTSR